MLLKDLHNQLVLVNQIFTDMFECLPESGQDLTWPEKQAMAAELWGDLSIEEIYQKIEDGTL
jgi:hypothetical protein